jgi:hypothetical protein
MKVSDNDYQKAIEKYVSLEDNETKLMIETSSRYIPMKYKKYTVITDSATCDALDESLVQIINLEDSSVINCEKDIEYFRRKLFNLFGLNPDEDDLIDNPKIEEVVDRIASDLYSNDVYKKLLEMKNYIDNESKNYGRL